MTKPAFTFGLARRPLFVASLIATILLSIGTRPAAAQAGQLDPTFGGGGQIVGPGITDAAAAMVIQPDGKIVIAGGSPDWPYDFRLIRYLPDGSLDASFGAGGVVDTDFFGFADGAVSLAIQPDGKIVAAGYAEIEHVEGVVVFALARYLPDGGLDDTFGDHGRAVTTDFSGLFFYTWVRALLLQPDGKLVAAGGIPYWVQDGANLARYNPDGTLDATFGAGGTATVSAPGMSGALAAVLQPDGKVVIAGDCQRVRPSGGLQSVFCLARVSSDGNLDKTFGTEGLVATPFGDNDGVRALSLQADGKLVAAGFTAVPSAQPNYNFILARYNPDGTLDGSFGTGGSVSTDFSGNDDIALAVTLQPDGRILTAGFTYTPLLLRDQFAVARYAPDGSLDETFGSGGKVTTDFATSAYAFAISLQPDEKIVVAGVTATGGVVDHTALARYLSTEQQSPLASLSVAPTSVISGDPATGTITLAAAQTNDVFVALSTDSPLATVPPSVTVPAGTTSGTFTVSTTPVFTTTSVDIRASLGDAMRHASLQLYAQTGVRSVVVDPTVVGGMPAFGTVSLTRAPGSSEAIAVMLSSDNQAATVPPSVIVPAGATSAGFTINTTTVAAATPVIISAAYPPILKVTATITVNPPTVAAPSNLSAMPVSLAQINLTWNDNSNNESRFDIERCSGTAAVCGANPSAFAVVASVAANVTSYSNDGLGAGTTYSYRVRALSAQGVVSAYSNVAEAMTGPAVTSATFQTTDTTTKGTWKGAYGNDGAVIVNDSTTLPSFAAVTTTAPNWTWAASTSDVRALQRKSSSDRIAATWYGWTLPLDVNLLDGAAHRVSIYLLDWDSGGRVERVDVRDAVTNALLDSRTVNSFTGGQYLTWTMQGHVVINIVYMSGTNAVVSGVFFN
jgi:uncharacterized delta-60 repeat protein